jgi:hypothetical protein
MHNSQRSSLKFLKTPLCRFESIESLILAPKNDLLNADRGYIPARNTTVAHQGALVAH